MADDLIKTPVVSLLYGLSQSPVFPPPGNRRENHQYWDDEADHGYDNHCLPLRSEVVSGGALVTQTPRASGSTISAAVVRCRRSS